MLGTWGYFKRINKNYICGYLLGGSVCVCVCVLSLCDCTSVNPAVPTVTYLGHLFPGRAGTCLWNSTWGTDKRERLFFFILKDKHTWYSNTHVLTRYHFNLSSYSQLSSWLRGFILSFAQMRISPLHNQSGQPPDAVTSVCVCVEVCLRVCLLHSITWATGPCNTSVPEDNFYFLASQSCLQHKQEPQKVIFSARCLIRQPGCRGRSLSVSIKAVVSR